MADANRINPHKTDATPEFVKETDHTPARVPSPLSTHCHDLPLLVIVLAHISDGFGLSAADVDPHKQWRGPGNACGFCLYMLPSAFKPSHPEYCVLCLVRELRKYPRIQFGELPS